MKLFTAAFGTETNSFSPLPTGLDAFRTGIWTPPGAAPDALTEMTAPSWLARRRAADLGWKLIEGSCVLAYPAGPVTATAYAHIRDMLLAEIEAALPLDAVVLSLHGAMMADGTPDCEGDFLGRVRALVGPDTVIGAELDLHCNLTSAMVRAADIIIAFKHYPHVDFLERAEELLDLVERQVRGEIQPHMEMFDCRMAGMFHTTRPDMAALLADVAAVEARAEILSVSLCHGFPWGDMDEMSAKVLVISDDAPDQARREAASLGRRFFDLRRDAQPDYVGLDAALALACDGPYPAVLADVSDNAGGGAAADSTHILRRLVTDQISDCCIGPIYDPGAVGVCFQAGEGAELDLRIGGKHGPQSGDPLDVRARVRSLTRDATQTFADTASPLGDVATVRAEGVDIVLTSERTQALGGDLFEAHGINLRDKRIIVVKSAQHFHAGFAAIAGQIFYVTVPGACNPDLLRLPYRNVKRPFWPLDDLVAL